MQNFYRSNEDLVAVARNEQEREMMYRGIIRGVNQTNIKYALHAISEVSEDFVQSDQGLKALTVYINRLYEADPEAASTLLLEQPESLRTQTMKNALKQNQ